MSNDTNASWLSRKKRVAVHGCQMAYIERGTGDPIVFLHGNPTSSYLWRNIMPHVEGLGRVIAPDLIGMGDSDKLDPSGANRYGFAEHRTYLDAFLDAAGVRRNAVLVIHDWGAALGFDWTRRNPERVKAIAYMEAIVAPIRWVDFPEAIRPIFVRFRSPEGEAMVLDQNIFIEKVLPAEIVRKLTDEEMGEYRRPYLAPGESRRPTLTWPRQLPIDGEPKDVVETAKAYGAFMTETEIPKLFVNAEPGAILTGGARVFCRTWKNQKEVTVTGKHYVQEDSPAEIGRALREWITGL